MMRLNAAFRRAKQQPPPPPPPSTNSKQSEHSFAVDEDETAFFSKNELDEFSPMLQDLMEEENVDILYEDSSTPTATITSSSCNKSVVTAGTTGNENASTSQFWMQCLEQKENNNKDDCMVSPLSQDDSRRFSMDSRRSSLESSNNKRASLPGGSPLMASPRKQTLVGSNHENGQQQQAPLGAFSSDSEESGDIAMYKSTLPTSKTFTEASDETTNNGNDDNDDGAYPVGLAPTNTLSFDEMLPEDDDVNPIDRIEAARRKSYVMRQSSVISAQGEEERLSQQGVLVAAVSLKSVASTEDSSEVSSKHSSASSVLTSSTASSVQDSTLQIRHQMSFADQDSSKRAPKKNMLASEGVEAVLLESPTALHAATATSDHRAYAIVELESLPSHEQLGCVESDDIMEEEPGEPVPESVAATLQRTAALMERTAHLTVESDEDSASEPDSHGSYKLAYSFKDDDIHLMGNLVDESDYLMNETAHYLMNETALNESNLLNETNLSLTRMGTPEEIEAFHRELERVNSELEEQEFEIEQILAEEEAAEARRLSEEVPIVDTTMDIVLNNERAMLTSPIKYVSFTAGGLDKSQEYNASGGESVASALVEDNMSFVSNELKANTASSDMVGKTESLASNNEVEVVVETVVESIHKPSAETDGGVEDTKHASDSVQELIVSEQSQSQGMAVDLAPVVKALVLSDEAATATDEAIEVVAGVMPRTSALDESPGLARVAESAQIETVEERTPESSKKPDDEVMDENVSVPDSIPESLSSDRFSVSSASTEPRLLGIEPRPGQGVVHLSDSADKRDSVDTLLEPRPVSPMRTHSCLTNIPEEPKQETELTAKPVSTSPFKSRSYLTNVSDDPEEDLSAKSVPLSGTKPVFGSPLKSQSYLTNLPDTQTGASSAKSILRSPSKTPSGIQTSLDEPEQQMLLSAKAVSSSPFKSRSHVTNFRDEEKEETSIGKSVPYSPKGSGRDTCVVVGRELQEPAPRSPVKVRSYLANVSDEPVQEVEQAAKPFPSLPLMNQSYVTNTPDEPKEETPEPDTVPSSPTKPRLDTVFVPNELQETEPVTKSPLPVRSYSPNVPEQPESTMVLSTSPSEARSPLSSDTDLKQESTALAVQHEHASLALTDSEPSSSSPFNIQPDCPVASQEPKQEADQTPESISLSNMQPLSLEATEAPSKTGKVSPFDEPPDTGMTLPAETLSKNEDTPSDLKEELNPSAKLVSNSPLRARSSTPSSTPSMLDEMKQQVHTDQSAKPVSNSPFRKRSVSSVLTPTKPATHVMAKVSSPEPEPVDPYEWAYAVWRRRGIMKGSLKSKAVSSGGPLLVKKTVLPSSKQTLKVVTKETETIIPDRESFATSLDLQGVNDDSPRAANRDRLSLPVARASTKKAGGRKSFANVLEKWRVKSDDKPNAHFLSPTSSVATSVNVQPEETQSDADHTCTSNPSSLQERNANKTTPDSSESFYFQAIKHQGKPGTSNLASNKSFANRQSLGSSNRYRCESKESTKRHSLGAVGRTKPEVASASEFKPVPAASQASKMKAAYQKQQQDESHEDTESDKESIFRRHKSAPRSNGDFKTAVKSALRERMQSPGRSRELPSSEGKDVEPLAQSSQPPTPTRRNVVFAKDLLSKNEPIPERRVPSSNMDHNSRSSTGTYEHIRAKSVPLSSLVIQEEEESDDEEDVFAQNRATPSNAQAKIIETGDELIGKVPKAPSTRTSLSPMPTKSPAQQQSQDSPWTKKLRENLDEGQGDGKRITPREESFSDRPWRHDMVVERVKSFGEQSIQMSITTEVCQCSNSVFSGSDDLVDFFLPLMGMACSCGKRPQILENPQEPTSLENILRPWQVDFLGAFGIERGDQLVKAHHRSGKALATALRQYRKKNDMAPFRTKSCSTAIQIWAKTSKAFVRSIRNQLTTGTSELTLPNTLYILSSFLETIPNEVAGNSPHRGHHKPSPQKVPLEAQREL